MADRRLHAIVKGRVQGVFFRASTRDEARRLCLAGWVRNLADGSVETEFQGEKEAVNRMLNWLHGGPPSARVDAVEWQERPLESESEFRVVY